MAESKPLSSGTEVQFGSLWAQVVARAWSDEAFKRRLLAQLAAVLQEAGLAVPEGVEFRVVEDTGRLVHLVLPPAPAPGELDDETLSRVAGGVDKPCKTIMSICPGTYKATQECANCATRSTPATRAT